MLKVFLISMEFPKPKRRRVESAQERRARLDINNERARAKRRTETEQQKKERLEKRNARDRARRSAEKPIEKQSRLDKQKSSLANESFPQREVRLENMSILQQQRLEAETSQERDARLEHLKVLQQQRLEAETSQERDARLNEMSTHQQDRLEVETQEQRSARLSRLERNRTSCSNGRAVPSLNENLVKEKVKMLHKEMASIEFPICCTCLEKFPGTKMASKSSECLRCYRDKKVPKLFSSDNNMSPGSVPAELQVSCLGYVINSKVH